jgi:antitoxin HicB
MLNYPITLHPDSNGTLLVGFPDIPCANSVGEDREDALANALEALEAAIELYWETGQRVPLPSSAGDAKDAVSLPSLASAKVLLWNDMLTQQISKTELASLLDVPASRIDSLFDLTDTRPTGLVEIAAQRLRERAVSRQA